MTPVTLTTAGSLLRTSLRVAPEDPASQFNIHEAKTHLSRLVERAAAGEEIIISKAGRPMARLGPVPKTPTPRKPGRWRGRAVIHDDFDELPPEVAAAFRGEEP